MSSPPPGAPVAPASSGSTGSSSRSGVATSRTARPELPSAGFTTRGNSASGISANSWGRAAAYVTGTGSPLLRAITAASALSRTPRIARTSFTVVSPTEAAASRSVSPGPPETVLRTQASWLPARIASDMGISERPGHSTSTWWPQAPSWRITSSGMPSWRYCSSTRKQSLIGAPLSSPHVHRPSGRSMTHQDPMRIPAGTVGPRTRLRPTFRRGYATPNAPHADHDQDFAGPRRDFRHLPSPPSHPACRNPCSNSALVLRRPPRGRLSEQDTHAPKYGKQASGLANEQQAPTEQQDQDHDVPQDGHPEAGSGPEPGPGPGPEPAPGSGTFRRRKFLVGAGLPGAGSLLGTTGRGGTGGTAMAAPHSPHSPHSQTAPRLEQFHGRQHLLVPELLLLPVGPRPRGTSVQRLALRLLMVRSARVC